MVEHIFALLPQPTPQNQKNSPGLWPNGVLDNQYIDFWLIPPYPPAGNLAQDSLYSVVPGGPQNLLGPHFSNFGGFLEPSKT